MKYENIKGFQAAEFKRVTGVSQETFAKMLEILRSAYADAHKRRGRHRKLPMEEMLLMTLEYYREYRTLEHIGASYGLQKSNVGKVVKWVEETLIKSGGFSLPGKKKLSGPETEFEIIVVDTTETPVQRPKHGQRQYCSGKKNGTRPNSRS